MVSTSKWSNFTNKVTMSKRNQVHTAAGGLKTPARAGRYRLYVVGTSEAGSYSWLLAACCLCGVLYFGIVT